MDARNLSQLKTKVMRNIVAGNWKSNKLMNEAREFTDAFLPALAELNGTTDVYIAPPAPYLASLSTSDSGRLNWAAQQCSAHGQGAFTGEFTAEMVQSAGAQAVLIGHSERREFFGESNDAVHAKVQHALNAGLRTFLCCGETLEQREAGVPERVIFDQLESALEGVNDTALLVIAYEPIWAIGTGRTATSQQAQDMHAAIRGWLTERFGADVAVEVPILYGGSCKPSNAEELFSQPDVNGGLIGGASLKPADFLELVRIADAVSAS